MRDGEVKANRRWCEGHRAFHGPLYPCMLYPPEVLAEVAEAEAHFSVEMGYRHADPKQGSA